MKAESKLVSSKCTSLQEAAVQGILMSISPLPIIFTPLSNKTDFFVISDLNTTTLIAILASISAFFSSFLISRTKFIGDVLVVFALMATSFVVFPYLSEDPFAALIGAVIFIGTAFFLFDLKTITKQKKYSSITSKSYSIQRAHYAVMAMPLMLLCRLFVDADAFLSSNFDRADIVIDAALALSAIIVQLIFFHAALQQKRKSISIIWTLLSLINIALLIAAFIKNYNLIFAVSFSSLIVFFVIAPSKVITENYGQWWEMFLNHPARILLTTFMGLCILGTLLLTLPISAEKGVIGVVDAAFTSVSAVCVTGLIVLDTPNDFTIFGQISILILIQMGGLGIMSITTVGMHAMGRRLSLRQERLMTAITETDHRDLIQSLGTILKFTFIAETIGAIILALLFYNIGDSTVGSAVWRGLFTAVSAFCNAGFALQSDNLIAYQQKPLILHTVAVLIILGGVAPATALLIPKLVRGKDIPISSYIALTTTFTLLISGTLFILVFDWNGVLYSFSVVDKIHNAWFQSVTLRTAGFNSIDIASVSDPTFIVMICLMFIGGSPGGTAGGVKTTTIGILILTFWANITNRKSVVVKNLRIQSRTIYRAITIVSSGVLTWFVIVLMLEITQQISMRDIIFEVTSAIGTVGLSTGATIKLDEIGKIIIMIAMFAGRVGPVTIFMLLSEERNDNSSRYQNAKISLT